MITKTCKLCGHKFDTTRDYQLFCGKTCSRKFHGSWRVSSLKVPTGTAGAISELRVCADLLSKGMEIFRAMSPSCSCDLAALQNGKLIRIEVTSGYENPENGKLFYPKHPKERFDILAIVLPSRIVYQPEL